MKFIVVDIEVIEYLNSGVQGKRLYPVRTVSDQWVLSEDIFSDEKTWGFAFDYLQKCEIINLELNQIYNGEEF